MPLPTLLQKGRLEQPDLPDAIPIDYIIDYVMTSLKQPPNDVNPFINRLMILEAKTASGKSITVPPRLWIAASQVDTMRHKTVLCTQPRVLTTIELAKEIDAQNYFRDQNYKFELGRNLSFQTGPFVQVANSGLRYATLGVLEMQLILNTPDQICRKYAMIIIDEAHERSMPSDNTIALLKQFMITNKSRPDLPYIVFASATFPYAKYARFFGLEPTSPNVIRVAGSAYPIDERWPTTSFANFYDAALERTIEAITETGQDVLEGRTSEEDQNVVSVASSSDSKQHWSSLNRIIVFVPGEANSREYKKKLEAAGLMRGLVINGVKHIVEAAYVDGNSVKRVTADYMRVLGGGGDVQQDNNKFEYVSGTDMSALSDDPDDLDHFLDEVFETIGRDEPAKHQHHQQQHKKTPKPEAPHQHVLTTLIMITTAVAETGLSLDHVKYVINCGWAKETEFNPIKNIHSMLVTKPAAQSNNMQRRGRVGRKKPGVYYPLFTKTVSDLLIKDQYPEVIKLEPTNLVLTLIAAKGRLGTPAEISQQLLDVPSHPAMTFSIQKLLLLGLIKSEGTDTNQTYVITESGKLATKMTTKLSVEAISMILAGYTWDCSIDDLIVIAVMMKYHYQQQSFVGRSRNEQDELRRVKNMTELARKEALPVERERVFATIFGYGDAKVSGGSDDDAFSAENTESDEGANDVVIIAGQELRLAALMNRTKRKPQKHESAPTPSLSRSIYYPLRALIADDFIESLFPFRALEIKFDEIVLTEPQNTDRSPTRIYRKLTAWAKSCFLNIESLLDAYSDYIDMKSTLVAAGFDILAGRKHDLVEQMKASINPETTLDPRHVSADITDQLTRLKLCIFHGYKMNLAEAVDARNFTSSGALAAPVSPSLYRMNYGGQQFTYNPRRLLFYSSVVLSKKGVYSLNVNGISVCDGYV